MNSIALRQTLLFALSAGLLLLGCGKEQAKEKAAAPSKQAESSQTGSLCEKAVKRINKMIVSGPEGSAPVGAEKAIIDGVMRASVATCENEGLSQAQADCILAVTNVEEFMVLGDCPAIKAKKPSWLRGGANEDVPAKAAQEVLGGDPSTVAGFWTLFQAAASSGDAAKFTGLTRFPFKTRGMMDGDPYIEYDEAAFAKLLPALLKADPGLNKEPTMKAMIAANASIPDSEVTEGKHFRIGHFEFELDGKVWKFAMAYHDTE